MALQENQTLKKLHYYENDISVLSAIAFGNVLKKNRSLELIDFSSTTLNCDGIRHILDGCKQNKTIKKLYFCTLGRYVTVHPNFIWF